MYQTLYSGFALAGLLTIEGTAAPDVPKIESIEQRLYRSNTTAERRMPMNPVTIGATGGQTIWLTGPWLDYAVSVNPSGNVYGTIKAKKDLGGKGEVKIELIAREAARGLKTLSVMIVCPLVAFDCRSGPLSFRVRVFHTGPVTRLVPSGPLRPNTVMTFELHGTGMDVAAIRGTDLLNPVIVGRTTNTIRIRGTTPQCGNLGPGWGVGVGIRLKEKDDLYDDYVYRGVTSAGVIIC